MASTFAWRIDHTPAAKAMATPSRTAKRFFAQSSMMRAIMAPPLGVSAGCRARSLASGLVLVVPGRGAERLHSRAQAALRVDEEVGRGHHLVGLGEAFQHLHASSGAGAEANDARLETALAARQEDVLQLARVDHRLLRHRQGVRGGDVEDYFAAQ